MRELMTREVRLPRARTIVALVGTGLFVAGWIELADGVARSTCDDGCGGGQAWAEDPTSPQWKEQATLARFGAAFMVLACVLGIWRKRLPAAVASGIALVLFVRWWDLAEEARFGPPPLGRAEGGILAFAIVCLILIGLTCGNLAGRPGSRRPGRTRT
jgi:hypothetical protein